MKRIFILPFSFLFFLVSCATNPDVYSAIVSNGHQTVFTKNVHCSDKKVADLDLDMTFHVGDEGLSHPTVINYTISKKNLQPKQLTDATLSLKFGGNTIPLDGTHILYKKIDRKIGFVRKSSELSIEDSYKMLESCDDLTFVLELDGNVAEMKSDELIKKLIYIYNCL